MKFRNFISSISESVKELSLNNILDKISKRSNLSDGEKNFLDNYDKIDDRDYHMISKESVIKIIENLKKSGRKVICNLHDRSGLIGSEILNVDTCTLYLKGGDMFKLNDKFLYNIIWDIHKNIYSLEEDSEYFEKIPVK